MRLRNKKTGEMGELQITEKHCAVVVGNGTVNCNVKLYCTLDKLNEDWEDYEEPKTEFYITAWGDIREYTTEGERFSFKQKLEIGNYFSSREEAEKTVEKLKAWKRLEDKGFRFRKWDWLPDQNIICGSIVFYIKDYNVDTNDLDLLFGGEE